MLRFEVCAVGSIRGAVLAQLTYATGGYLGVVDKEIGQGEDRTAYLVDDVVYKVGYRQSENVTDHESLEEWRKAGAPWAPPSTLYRLHTSDGIFRLTDEADEEWTVLAMPDLRDDGTEADPEAVATMQRQAGHVDRTNYTVREGRPYVIDGNAIELGPPTCHRRLRVPPHA